MLHVGVKLQTISRHDFSEVDHRQHHYLLRMELGYLIVNSQFISAKLNSTVIKCIRLNESKHNSTCQNEA